MTDKRTITAATIDLTEGCNLNCTYCFTYNPGHQARRVDEGRAREFITFLLKQHAGIPDAFNLSFWGGEPTLEFEVLKRLAAFAREEADKFQTRVVFNGTTNGTLLNGDILDWSVKNNLVWLVSLDGIKPAHDLHRKRHDGSGSWEVVDRNIREAVSKYGPHSLSVRSSISPQTVQWLGESAEYIFNDLGLNRFSFSPVTDMAWDDRSLSLLSSGQEAMFKILETSASKRVVHVDRAIARLYERQFLNAPSRITAPAFPCGAGRTYVCLSVDGFVFPCHRFNKHGISSEDRAASPSCIGTFSGEGVAWKPFRDQFYQWGSLERGACSACDHLHSGLCLGGCPAWNYDRTGSISSPAPEQCDFIRVASAGSLDFFSRMVAAGKVELLKQIQREESGSSSVKGCLCNNGCYSEGSLNGKVTLSNDNSAPCQCYAMRYTGSDKATFTPFVDQPTLVPADIAKLISEGAAHISGKQALDTDDVAFLRLVSQVLCGGRS